MIQPKIAGFMIFPHPTHNPCGYSIVRLPFTVSKNAF